jgi:hypothetical protein
MMSAYWLLWRKVMTVGPIKLLMIPTGHSVNEVDCIGGIAGNDRHFRTAPLHEKSIRDEGMEKKVFYFEDRKPENTEITFQLVQERLKKPVEKSSFSTC